MKKNVGGFDLAATLLQAAANFPIFGGGRNGSFFVLNYHRILSHPDPLLESDPDVDTFRKQMELLADCFHVLPLYEAVQAVGTRAIGPKSVCITFDDGYRSVHDLALPILRELRLPATVFVTSGPVHEGNMWNDNIIDALRCLPKGRIDLRDVGLGTYMLGPVQDRKEVITHVIRSSKYLPPHKRQSLEAKLAEMTGKTEERRLMLTRDMLVALANSGIEIGGHTVTHPILTNLDDESAQREIVDNKNELESIINKPVRLFAYPNGKVGIDFDERHVKMVREAGYKAAFTTLHGAVTASHDCFQLPRGLPWDKSRTMFGMRLLRWLGAA